MSTVSSLFTGSGMYPSMFENQMKKNSVATSGNHFAAAAPGMLPLAIWV